MSSHKLLLAFAAALLVSGCAGWKPVVRTLDDIARIHCANYFAKVQGVSLEDAFEAYCRTREAWAPWIDPVIRAQSEGVETVEAQAAAKREGE